MWPKTVQRLSESGTIDPNCPCLRCRLVESARRYDSVVKTGEDPITWSKLTKFSTRPVLLKALASSALHVVFNGLCFAVSVSWLLAVLPRSPTEHKEPSPTPQETGITITKQFVEDTLKATPIPDTGRPPPPADLHVVGP